MYPHEYILVSDFCAGHGISVQMAYQLKHYGLIEITDRQGILYMKHEDLQKAEKIIRLHADLEINFEGIQVIDQLLTRLDEMQTELNRLKNTLGRYE